MDFQSFQAMHDDSNVGDVRDMSQYLGQYGPVMLAHYKPQFSTEATFFNDMTAMMTDSFISEMNGYGLFAWSFMDQCLFDDVTASAIEAANYQLVRDAVLRYGPRS